MSLHKLSAGDGYTYLTRQVAVQDSTERGLSGLGEYYSEKGESPGVWLGRGTAGLAGFDVSLTVGERQMVALFGEGRHPDADRIEAQEIAASGSVRAALAASRLGRPFQAEGAPTAFRIQLATRLARANSAAGRPRGTALPDDERARIRTQLAQEMFATEYSRAPADARELSGFLARAGRPAVRAVAGYDLTFTPVKSVSALWAVADPATAEVIERAHTELVAETLGWLEDRASFTRLGAGGVRQVEVLGLIAAAFVHRDSRAGDPNLHTHVAVSNKVQVASGPDAGRWMAVDGRPLHQLAVAASERYTTRLEAVLRDRLGVTFADRPGGAVGKRPVRELVGVDPRLLSFWSSRRTAIDARRSELASRFQADHGRPPTPVEALKLAQRATLETRQAKHEPRSQAEQRQVWLEQAQQLLGGGRLASMLTGVHQPAAALTAPRPDVTPVWVELAAQQVVETVQGGRATWREAHLRAEAERVVRGAGLPHAQLDDAVERVVAAALAPALSLPLSPHQAPSSRDGVTWEEPAALRRSDGSSVYLTAGSDLFTSASVLAGEDALLDLGGKGGGRAVPGPVVELALLEAAANGRPLNSAQAHLVRAMATSGARLQLALAPAGTGKTTALRVLARAWTDSGGTVLGLAPSAAAAAVLRAELDGAPTDTLAKLLWSIDQLIARDPGAAAVPGWVHEIGPSTLLLLDEAGMAGTVDLSRAAEYVTSRGGSVRLVGDDAQLRAVAAGGVLRDLAREHGAVTLDAVVRFRDPAEGRASLALRAGDPVGLGFYLDRQRVHVGDPTTAADQAYAAWQADRLFGLDALLLASTREQVLALSLRARADRLTRAAQAGRPVGPERQLADASHVSAGDVVLTRRNDRRLATSATDWVKNGYRWQVTEVRPDGGLAVTHVTTGRTVLPPDYVGAHVTLGYASTVHTAQGSTADTAHVVVIGNETRELLYVGLTRGRTANHVYAVVTGNGDPHRQTEPDVLAPPTAVELLTRVLSRDGAQTSATTTVRQLADPARQLADAAARYTDAVQVAAQQHLAPERLLALDVTVEQVLPGLTDAAAWPALRDRLTLLAANGPDPDVALRQAVAQGALQDARDLAAVLDWRVTTAAPPPPALAGVESAGLLPWLPTLPRQLAGDPTGARTCPPCTRTPTTSPSRLPRKPPSEDVTPPRPGRRHYSPPGHIRS